MTCFAHSIYLHCLAAPDCIETVHELSGKIEKDGTSRNALSCIEQNGIVAVIEEVDAREFSPPNLQSVAWVGERACHHASVVEKILRTSPVMPVKFGTIFDSAESVLRFLTVHQNPIFEFLQNFRGKSEWGVQIFLDTEKSRSRFSEKEPGLKGLTCPMESTPGIQYLQKKQAATLLEKEWHFWIKEIINSISKTLHDYADASVKLSLSSDKLNSRPAGLVFNTSFLIDENCLPVFKKSVADLNAIRVEDGLIIRFIGPWAPYHFCPELSGR